MICSIPGCGDNARSRGWCEVHYRRWLRLGDADAPVREMGAWRGWIAGLLDSGDPAECWEWPFARHPFGYGKVKVDGRTQNAARVVYELNGGPIPKGMVVMHSCDNPSCCNPAHLSPGTPADNAHDRDQKGRQRNGRSTLSRVRNDDLAPIGGSQMTATNAVQFGRQPSKAPAGNFREIHFPQLALLDQGTNEGILSRILHSEGGTARGLPRTVYFQKGQEMGHMGSVAIGSLHEVTLDPQLGIMSGKGWLADVTEAHEALPFIVSKALFHNSVDLAEVKVREEVQGEWWGDPDFHVDLHFDEWKLAATTLVGKPAFADAHATIPDEIKAALDSMDPIEMWAPETKIRILIAEDPDAEILASASGLPPWDYFFTPETAPQKILVSEPDAAGFHRVYGHLSMWESCHDGVEGTCMRTPRPQDNYASYNKPGVLTDKGMVETGPIAMYGGHVPLSKAFDDPANAWADVRVIPGVHGPWISGIVRPGTEDSRIYAARASQISGHWKGGRLRAIVSCNAGAYDIPGSGFSINSKGLVDELVASFCGPTSAPPLQGLTTTVSNPNATTTTVGPFTFIDMSSPTTPTIVEATDDSFEVEKQKLMLEIELEDE